MHQTYLKRLYYPNIFMFAQTFDTSSGEKMFKLLPSYGAPWLALVGGTYTTLDLRVVKFDLHIVCRDYI